jgi:energy-coupling factor transport system permease protein
MSEVPLKLHPISWFTWLAMVLVIISTTRNPLYLLILLLALNVVASSVDQARQRQAGKFSGQDAPLLFAPLRFAAIVVFLAGLFNALISRFGDTVLFTLPEAIPLIGGAITLEAIAFGVINGLIIASFFTAFVVFNTALPTHALIRYVPRAFFPVAVVVTIAISFLPGTLQQARRIREAQAVRGHQVRGLRDGVALFIPLLVSGLERALQLAEAMTARGFARAESEPGNADRLGIVAGLSAVLAGWLMRLLWGLNWPGLSLMLGGVGVIGGILWKLGRRSPRSTYRRDRWTMRDGLMIGAALLPGLVFLGLVPGFNRSNLAYNTYPLLEPPSFALLPALVLLSLLVPAGFYLRAEEPGD